MGRSSASRMTGKSRHCASVFDQWAGNDWRRNHHESVARPRATTASSTTCRGSGRESQSAEPRRTKLRMNYPAACREFVIPAETGIQRARLDSPVSSTGQACQAWNDGPEQKTIPRSLPRGSSLRRVLKGRCLFVTAPVFRHGVFLQLKHELTGAQLFRASG